MSRRAPGPFPTASTRLVALLGWPVHHSLSPVIHNAAFREDGHDNVYVALPTPPDRLADVVRALRAVDALGANVTVPHKGAVVRLCDRLTEEAALIGAVNTLSFSDGSVIGDNTDAIGFGVVLRDDIGAARGVRAVLLGTGGAARAAAVALGRRGAHVVVAGRRPEAADDVADLAGRAGAEAARAIDLADRDGLREAVRGAHVLVNATTLGMSGERLPDPFHEVQRGQVVADMVYGGTDTPFVADARARGAAAFHGVGMLVAQAAASYERWTGGPAPVGVMSAAAVAAIERGSSPDGDARA